VGLDSWDCTGSELLGRDIFYDDLDRTKYLEILSRLKQAHSFRIHAYVLMLNHVHLLLQTSAVPLSRVMQRLSSGYTQSGRFARGKQNHGR